MDTAFAPASRLPQDGVPAVSGFVVGPRAGSGALHSTPSAPLAKQPQPRPPFQSGWALPLPAPSSQRSVQVPLPGPRPEGQAAAAAAPRLELEGVCGRDGEEGAAEAVQALLAAVQEGLDAGQEPEACLEGLGGAYFLRGAHGQRVAIAKPSCEEPLAIHNPKGLVGRQLGEPGMKPSVRVGEAALRESAAYLLDARGFAGVPATALVQLSHAAFHHPNPEPDAAPAFKRCSLQAYVDSVGDTSEMGASRFSVADVHRLGILDLRLFNTDRHSGNILVRAAPPAPGGSTTPPGGTRSPAALTGPGPSLVPIDHGFCLPEMLEPPFFEWLHWPQASMAFSREELAYIAALDPAADRATLQRRLPELREGCLRVLEVATLFLQRGAAAGLSLAEIGMAASRAFVGVEEEPSELEALCVAAREQVVGAAMSGDEAGSPLSPRGGSCENLPLTPMDTASGSGDSAQSAQTLLSAPHTPRLPRGPHSEELLFNLEEEPEAWAEDDDEDGSPSVGASPPAPPLLPVPSPFSPAARTPLETTVSGRSSTGSVSMAALSAGLSGLSVDRAPSNLGPLRCPSSAQSTAGTAQQPQPQPRGSGASATDGGTSTPSILSRVARGPAAPLLRPGLFDGARSVARGYGMRKQGRDGPAQQRQARAGQAPPDAAAADLCGGLSPPLWDAFKLAFSAGLDEALSAGRFRMPVVPRHWVPAGTSCP